MVPYRKMAASARQLGGALTAPQKSVYAGSMARTFNSYVYCLKNRYSMQDAYPGVIDQIQRVFFAWFNLSGVCAADEVVNSLTYAHEYMKVAYTGISVRPMMNSSGPSSLFSHGDMALVPIQKVSAYVFAFAATQVSPVYAPPYLDVLLDHTENTDRPISSNQASPRWSHKFQPGVQSDDMAVNPYYGGALTYVSRPRMVPSDWSPTFRYNYSPPMLNSIDDTIYWSPMLVLANFNTSSSLPVTLEYETRVKFMFKNIRLSPVVPSAVAKKPEEHKGPGPICEMRVGGDHPERLSKRRPDPEVKVEEVKTEVEEYVDPYVLSEDEEKMVIAEHVAQKKRTSVSSVGSMDAGHGKKPTLQRALTNLNLATQPPPSIVPK